MLTRDSSIKSIEAPLVLISQVQRSGGTLLSQLFDGHPQVCAFPSELHLVKGGWVNLTDCVDDLRGMLSPHDRVFSPFIREGYQKFSIIDGEERHPFDYDLALRDKIMSSLLHDRAMPPSNRDVFNAFFTAFFAAWSRQRLLTINPKYIVAFAARTNMYLAKTATPRFFIDYPDGHLITLVRRPLSWFASARRHAPRYETFSVAIQLWIDSTSASLKLRGRFPEQVTLTTFEALVSQPENTMRHICRRLDLEFDPALSVPTFDGRPIKSDSNFMPSYGIDQTVLHRDDFVPETKADRQFLKTAEELYLEVVVVANLTH